MGTLFTKEFSVHPFRKFLVIFLALKQKVSKDILHYTLIDLLLICISSLLDFFTAFIHSVSTKQ